MNESSYEFNPPCAGGVPACHGQIRSTNEDFRVTERMGFEPEGSGEHVWLYIEKNGVNTQWLAEQLARIAGRHPRDVGLSGLKDRHAVTRQWFSIYLPKGEEPDWSGALAEEPVQVLQHSRHSKKIRRGIHRANAFDITLRNLTGDLQELEQRLERVRDQGVPNYFGAQRFGHGMQNLHKAERWLIGDIKRARRNEQDRWLSATRSWLFNAVLGQRVTDGNWNTLLPGDLAQLNNSHSFFVVDAPDETLRQRCEQMDIHPTGPLFGAGDNIAPVDQAVLARYQNLTSGLLKKDVKMARRSLRLVVQNLNWVFENNNLTLGFELEAGGFATAVLSELLKVEDVSTDRSATI